MRKIESISEDELKDFVNWIDNQYVTEEDNVGTLWKEYCKCEEK